MVFSASSAQEHMTLADSQQRDPPTSWSPKSIVETVVLARVQERGQDDSTMGGETETGRDGISMGGADCSVGVDPSESVQRNLNAGASATTAAKSGREERTQEGGTKPETEMLNSDVSENPETRKEDEKAPDSSRQAPRVDNSSEASGWHRGVAIAGSASLSDDIVERDDTVGNSEQFPETPQAGSLELEAGQIANEDETQRADKDSGADAHVRDHHHDGDNQIDHPPPPTHRGATDIADGGLGQAPAGSRMSRIPSSGSEYQLSLVSRSGSTADGFARISSSDEAARLFTALQKAERARAAPHLPSALTRMRAAANRVGKIASLTSRCCTLREAFWACGSSWLSECPRSRRATVRVS